MNELAKVPLRIGAWRVDPPMGEISKDGEVVRVEPRAMRLLQYLASRAGEVVGMEEMLDQVWPGVVVTQDSVYQAITGLRRLLGDDPKRPVYIATVPRLGYRLIAKVAPWNEAGEPEPIPPSKEPVQVTAPVPQGPVSVAPVSRWVAAITVAVLVPALAISLFVIRPAWNPVAAVAPRPAQRSIGVLPFLDLTEGMQQEEFADGMTEELIDKLSKVEGLRVPAPTASFHLKGRQLAVAEVGKELGVVYVLDGSVRKSGAKLRVAARLMRAEDGYVLWSETYDRSSNDLLALQDDIAAEVRKALAKALS